MTSLVIMGGSDAGTSAALRARELNASAEVTIVLADRFPNFSVCGLPFYLSGEVPDWHWLAHRTAEDITREGIHLLLDHTAQTIDPANHLVTVANRGGQVRELMYDRLVIATGAVPVRPPIPGLDLPGVYLLRSMEDSFAVHAYLETHAPRSAVIVVAATSAWRWPMPSSTGASPSPWSSMVPRCSKPLTQAWGDSSAPNCGSTVSR